MIKLTRHTQHGYSFGETYHPKWRRCEYWDLPEDLRQQPIASLYKTAAAYMVLLTDGVDIVYPLTDAIALDAIDRQADKILEALAKTFPGNQLNLIESREIAARQSDYPELKLDQLNGLLTFEAAIQQAIYHLGLDVEVTALTPFDLEIGDTEDIEGYAAHVASLSLWDQRMAVNAKGTEQ